MLRHVTARQMFTEIYRSAIYSAWYQAGNIT